MSLVPLTGDVSPRAYFRLGLTTGTSAILAVYPPQMSGTYQRFLETTSLLSEARVPVPAVLEHDGELRFMLLQDLGPRSLFELGLTKWSAWLPYFESALDLAARIPGLESSRVGALNPRLDAAALEQELEQTRQTYLSPQGMLADPEIRGALEKSLAALCGELCKAPLRPCHRDFMARNLMPVEVQEVQEVQEGGSEEAESLPRLTVLDHQDLRLGPATYDLASLLNDSLFPPPAIESILLQRSGAPEAEYRRAAVQRTLKAVGTYASFANRGVPRHLPLIPPTLRRALFHMERLPELCDLAATLSESWAPWLVPGRKG